MSRKYAIRTCDKCGIRLPQPEMYLKEEAVETGRSRSTVSGSTWLGGFLFGDSKSLNSINRWIFNTGQRTYSRKRKVWLCSSCSGMFFINNRAFIKIKNTFMFLMMILLLSMCVISAITNKNTQENKSQLETVITK